ncbi:hypothetical protein I0P04_001864 [Staphylococcus pseudintermedius]|nr:hypothetical protein [Staphylococcus pseudintermedius]MCE5684564.1 hypothetical protein [Staphylococcus pseudintermedius]HDU1417103.1 hypothetical protein [Staphylococcus pseudintermedius]
MENQNEQGLMNDRITSIEKRINYVDKKVDDLEDKVDDIKDKNDERHLEMVKLTTELKGFSKSTEENTKRMANSIEGLVEELKQSNSRTDDRFIQLNKEVNDVKATLDNGQFEKTLVLERKKLSNGVIIALISGGFVIVELLIKVVAPLLGL